MPFPPVAKDINFDYEVALDEHVGDTIHIDPRAVC